MKNHLGKILATVIIVLFIGVSFSSAISIDTKPSISTKESIEDCGCNEVSDADIVKLEKQLNVLEIYSKLLLVLSKDNLELNEKYEKYLDLLQSINLRDYLKIVTLDLPVSAIPDKLPDSICMILFWLVFYPMEIILYKLEYSGHYFIYLFASILLVNIDTYYWSICDYTFPPPPYWKL